MSSQEIRECLTRATREQPVSCAAIADEIGIERDSVAAVLKQEVDAGRALREKVDGKYVYWWAEGAETTVRAGRPKAVDGGTTVVTPPPPPQAWS